MKKESIKRTFLKNRQEEEKAFFTARNIIFSEIFNDKSCLIFVFDSYQPSGVLLKPLCFLSKSNFNLVISKENNKRQFVLFVANFVQIDMIL